MSKKSILFMRRYLNDVFRDIEKYFIEYLNADMTITIKMVNDLGDDRWETKIEWEEEE